MATVTEIVRRGLGILDYPLVAFGKTPITLGILFLNLFVVLAFLFISSKIKNFLIHSVSSRSELHVANWRAAVTLGYYAVLGIGLVAMLQTVGLDLRLLTVLTGAIGIGVGFGMQSIFSNFIGGIIILLEKPLKLGDRIEVGDVAGNVRSISVRATTVVTNDNVSIIVPNSDFISKQVINWSHSGNSVRIHIPINVAYDSDPEKVKRLLLEVADEEVGVLKDPTPTVRLAEFGENGLRFGLLVWTHEFSDRTGALKSLINFQILKKFKEQGVQIPFPQRDIFIRNPRSSDESLI